MSDTLQKAKDHKDKKLNAGLKTTCRCCGTELKRYRRKLNRGMAAGLIAIYNATPDNPGGWLHVTKYFLQLKELGIAFEYPKLEYWGLLEPLASQKTQGTTPGFWRITPKGRDFVEETIKVPSHALVLAPQSRFQGLDGDLIGIRKALGSKFDYDELMAARP